jgi:hypothetical protein
VTTTQLPAARNALGLLAMSADDLDDLYRGGSVGETPRGFGAGTAILVPGQKIGKTLAKLTALVAWQGKVVDDDRRQLVNLVTPLRLRAIRADLYGADSWLDGKPCIVIDYSTTSLCARWVRDEIREVGPGLFLGLVYLRKRRLPVRFVLDFRGE